MNRGEFALASGVLGGAVPLRRCPRPIPARVGVMAANGSSGLPELGHAVVEKMNALGVAIDLSHANAAATRDVLAGSAPPVLITHGGCAAVHAHPRNKSDGQLRAVAVKGGIVGIYDLPYLTASPRHPTLADYLEHMTHALTVCGEDHVGIGSDQSVQAFDTSPDSPTACCGGADIWQA